MVVHWVTGGVDRCQVGFVPQHFIKYMDIYNGVLAQVIDVYSTADNSNYRKQKVYKNYVLLKRV